MLSPIQESILDALSGAAIIAYLVVAYVQLWRPVSEDARLARNGFVLWWTTIAFIGFYGLLADSYFEVDTLPLYRLVLYTLIPLIFAALGGLVYYLAYLYTGNRNAVRWITVFYIVLTLLFIVFIEVQQPYYDGSIDPETGEAVGFAYAKEAPAWAGLLFSVALVLPPFAAAIAYFALFFRARDNTVKFRILMVSSGFILWMGFSLFGSLSRFAQGVEERGFDSQLIGQLLGLLSALLVLLAYFPPKFMKGRFGLNDLGDDVAIMEAAALAENDEGKTDLSIPQPQRRPEGRD